MIFILDKFSAFKKDRFFVDFGTFSMLVVVVWSHLWRSFREFREVPVKHFSSQLRVLIHVSWETKFVQAYSERRNCLIKGIIKRDLLSFHMEPRWGLPLRFIISWLLFSTEGTCFPFMDRGCLNICGFDFFRMFMSGFIAVCIIFRNGKRFIQPSINLFWHNV